MKKYVTILGLSLTAVLTHAQTTTENYIYTKTYLDYPSGVAPKISQSVQYLDGLGRARQTVAVKASPTGKDYVTPVTYDAFGRQAKEILPVPVNTLNGSVHSGITNESNANTYYGVSNAFSEKQFENSPLERVLQQAHPGDPWKLGSGKTIQYNYAANTTGEVKKFVTTTTINTVSTIPNTVSVVAVSAENNAFASGGYYAKGTLTKNTVTDEDGNPAIQFENERGQVLLFRKTDGEQNIDTYYVYNEYGQKAFVIPPKAVKGIEANNNSITAAILDGLCYQYRYDGRDREVEKKLPGKGWEFTVYDKQDRPILRQDAVLRTVNNNFNAAGWLFTKYDQFGRVVYTGFFASSATRQAIQNSVNTLANASNNEKRSTTPFTSQGISVYYDKLAYPTTGMTLLTVSYYDTYPPEAPAVPSTVLGQYTLSVAASGSSSATTNDLQTASYIKNIEDDNWTKTYTYYNTKGKPVATKSTNHLGGYTHKEYKLDFSGLAQESYTYHKRTPVDSEVKIRERAVYDSQNRLLKQYHQVNSLPEELLADNTYNEIGELIKKKTGNTTGTPLQSIDYTYNIRGWLTSVNNPNVPASFNEKLFGLELKYNNPVNASASLVKYNGNISQTDWKTTSDGVLRRYTYQYDKLDRLFYANYSKPNNTVANTMAYDELLEYDVNGNIVHIDRYGAMDGNQAQMIDELELAYDGNRLMNVLDNTGNPLSYPLGGNAIAYDINGNMTNHKDKNINKITYNHLNLPVNVNMVQGAGLGMMGEGNIIEFKYRADGVKVEKVTNFVNPYTDDVTNINYLDGFQYQRKYTKSNTAQNGNDSGYLLQFMPTSEGYYDYQKKRYIYNYEDQVGNIRLSYYKGSTGSPVIDKETNYYPFGMEHSGYNGVISQTPNYRYAFQGQEKQQETGWSSFKWRNSIPELGRFFNVDPLSEKYAYQSHYNFSENRVTDGKELEGLEWTKSISVNDNGSKTYTTNGKFKVLNNAQDIVSNSDLKYYFPRFTKQMEDSYNGNTTSGDQLKVGKIDYQIVDKVDPAKDYYIELTSQVVEKDGSPSTASGKVDKIGDTQVNRMQINVKKTNLPGIVAHEVNHTAGNRHQNDPKNEIKGASAKITYDNMMQSPIQTGNKLIPEQRDIMLKNIPDEKTP